MSERGDRQTLLCKIKTTKRVALEKSPSTAQASEASDNEKSLG